MAMDQEHRLPLTSYDRLFPNQDVMPDGGFGNLIALPLQREARERGNTIFLDDDLEPYPDPWSALADVLGVSAEQLDAWVGAFQENASKPFQDDAEEDVPPWLRNPSRTSTPAPIPNKPDEIRVVRGQMLFIERSELPSALLSRIKRLAVISNPEFHRKEAMRLSVAGTPRLVRCFEEDERWLSIPRGLEDELTKLAGDLDIALVLDDQTNTLILVHRQPLVDQWKARLCEFLGLEPKQIGIVAAGIQSQFGALAAHPERTEMIVSDVRQLVGEGFHPLILTERVEHLEILEGLLRPHVGSLVVLKGGGSAKVRRERTATIDGLGDKEPWAILATGRYVGEGFDEPRLDALVLAMPISWKGTLTQYAGHHRVQEVDQWMTR